MMEDLISVILPIYNVAPYLPACLDSLLAQTYQNLEIILVDDGSPDEAPAICDEYARRDSRIVVLHQENQGLGAARNNGMALARGAYIAFIDPDDLVMKDYLEVLYRDMIEQNADIVCCNAVEELNGERYDSFCVREHRRIQSADICYRDSFVARERYGHIVWAKLIKTNLAKRYVSSSRLYAQDALYMLELFAESPVVYLDPYVGYVYIRWADSVTMKYGKHNVIQRIDNLATFQYGFRSTLPLSPETRRVIAESYAYGVHTAAATTILAKNGGFRQHRKMLLDCIRELRPAMGQLSRKNRLRLWLYQNLPGVYWLCIKALPLLGKA